MIFKLNPLEIIGMSLLLGVVLFAGINLGYGKYLEAKWKWELVQKIKNKPYEEKIKDMAKSMQKVCDWYKSDVVIVYGMRGVDKIVRSTFFSPNRRFCATM